jgi:hypothetical protein
MVQSKVQLSVQLIKVKLDAGGSPMIGTGLVVRSPPDFFSHVVRQRLVMLTYIATETSLGLALSITTTESVHLEP